MKKIDLPDNFDDVAAKCSAGEIKMSDGADLLGLKKSTFSRYFYLRGFSRPAAPFSEIPREIIDEWFRSEITAANAARRVGCSTSYFSVVAHRTRPRAKTARRQLADARAEIKAAKRTEMTNRRALFVSLGERYLAGSVTSREAGEKLGVQPGTFVKRVNSYFAR